MFNPKKLTLLSSIAVRKNKLNEGIADEKVKTVVNKVLKKNEGGLYYVNSYAEGNGNDRIYLMVYQNENIFIDKNHIITEYSVFYFIDKDALSEKQIDEIRKEFEIGPGSWGIKKDFDNDIKDNDIKYQKKFENKIKELGVDLYVFDTRGVQKNVQYSESELLQIKKIANGFQMVDSKN